VSRRQTPTLEFDGRIFWYVGWFDPADDICCAPDCRKPIAEEEVPLCLFKSRIGGAATHQSRLHFACADRLGLLRLVARRPS
jgi:hypothetical protein